MNLKEFILANITLEDGRTFALDCPYCGGRGKFSATVADTMVLYNCYRASCVDYRGKPTRGALHLNLTPEARINALKTKKRGNQGSDELGCTLPWVVPDYWIDGIGDAECAKYMKDKHMWEAFTEKRFRPLYDPALRRFIFPIKNSYGEIIGAIGKSLIGATPKTLNYNRAYLQPFVCGHGRKSVLLVEDCASAVAATRNPEMAGIALLGTHMREEFIPHLSPYKVVYIALDQDAYSKSIKLREQLMPYIKNVNIVRLTKDIKDMTDDEYKQLI